MFDIFTVFLRLGLTSFGGPIAHLDIFRREFVDRRAWLSAHVYAEIVALCSVLPGATSSQVGLSVGLQRGGARGALAAWLGFTLPSAIIMVVFAALILGDASLKDAAWIHGLKVATVAIVAQAIWGMTRTYCLDVKRLLAAIIIAALVAVVPSLALQLVTLTAGALMGLRWQWAASDGVASSTLPPTRPGIAVIAIGMFGALLVALPLLAHAFPNTWLVMAEKFYRAGALVFGGGHVVLPLLHQEFVASGQMDADTFLAGYGMAQAVPGPLFTFAAYVGAVLGSQTSMLAAAVLALTLIFLPSVLLVVGAMPALRALQQHAQARHALAGINVAVVGFLMAAFCTPILPTAILGPIDLLIAGLGVFMLMGRRWPSWVVVGACAALAQGFALFT